MLSYQGVTVGIPAGGHAPGRGQDGLAANWVVWSTGELRIDPGSFNLCFIPGGTHSFTPKPLGCLLGAYVVQGEPGGPPSIIANTNDTIHSKVQLNFEKQRDEDSFMQLARTVEAKRAVANPRRSSLGGSPAGWEDGLDPSLEHLSEIIRDRCVGSWPLIYVGAELYGPHDGADGAEVLLGRGAVVLLDPPAEGNGTYDLLFYDETSGEPTLRVPVGPKLKISRQPEVEAHPGRLSAPRASMAKRMSMGPALSACFDFSVQGVGVSALTFDRELEAESFVRDLSVRLGLTRAGLKANREMNNVGSLQGQLHTLKRNSLFARSCRWMLGLFIFAVCLMTLQTCVLYFNEDRPLVDVLTEVLGNTAVALEVLGGTARNFGTAMCQAIEGGRAVPASAVDACARIPFAEEAQTCIRDLSSRGHIR